MKSKLVSVALPILVLLVASIFFQIRPGNRTAKENDRSVAVKNTNKTTGIESATTIENANSFSEFAEKINNKSLSIKTIDLQKWSEIESERNLSIAPKRNFIVDSTAVRVSFAALSAARDRAFDQLNLDLGTGKTVVAEIGSRHDHGVDAYSFTGRLKGDPESEFSISVYKDAVVGTFTSAEFGTRQLRFVAPGIHRVDEIDQSLAPHCAPPLMDTVMANASSQVAGSPRLSEGISPSEFPLDGVRPGNRVSHDQSSGEQTGKVSQAGLISGGGSNGETEMDVLVAYTQATIANEGSLNATLALINQGVVDTNTAFQNSSIDAVVRLVGTVQVSYSGSAASAALNAFRSTTDGSMDEIHALRDTYGADFVSLWIPLSDYCGIASLITTLSTSQDFRAFSVCDPDCQFQYTFSHELGHNWGSAHAVGDAGTVRGRGIFDYSHGWRWNGSNGLQYRSILAYSPGTRVKHFTDPYTNYSGGTTGRQNLEENARSINQIKGTMSQFRTTALDDHGNTRASATSVSTSSTSSGVLESTSDIDVFRITISSNETLIATTSGSTNTRGRLLNNFGTTIASDLSSGTGNNFSISEQLTPGTYYVEVLSESNSTGSYLLSIAGGGGDDHGNSILTATSVPLSSNTSGSLEEGDDEDFFRISVPEAGTLTVTTTGTTDTYGYLLNSSGTTIVSDDDSGSSINFRIQRTLTAGVYFVRLTGYSSSTTGPYQLSVSFFATPDDHANSFTEATGVSSGTTANPSVIPGNFESIGDVDFLRFTLFGSNDLDLGPIAHEELILDIEPIGNFPYSQNGFTLAPYPGGRFSVVNNNTNSAFPPGSYIRLLSGDSLEITDDNGELFDVVSIDLSEYSTVFQSPQTLSWIGFKPDGTTVTHTVVTDGVIDGTGSAVDFETFLFPASFTGITKLQAGSGNILNADNFVLRTGSTTIPTGTLSIFSSGPTDTVATLYNSNFVSVAIDDNSGTSLNFAINRNDFPTGTYYLRLSEFGNNSTGFYNVHIGYDQVLALPAAPTGFNATQNNDEAVFLQWDSVQNSTSYSVYRGNTSVFDNASKIAENLTSPSYSDSTAVPGQTYTYWATASNTSGESQASAGTSGLRAFERPEILSQPASGSIPGGTSASLSVTAASNIGTLSYQWYQGATGDMSNPVGSNSPNYSTPLLVQDSLFWVRVSNGFNQQDSQAAAITLLLPPPPLVTASRGTSDSGIQVRWVPVNQANSYSIYRATTDDYSSSAKIATTTESSFIDTSATAGNTYYYYIRVINSAGNESEPSGSSSHSGYVSDTPIDADFIPATGISDISYSNNGGKLFVAGDSGWVDAYTTFSRNLTQWAGINSPVSGIDASHDRVIAAGSNINQGNSLLFDVNFSSTIPTISNVSVPLDSGDTGLNDAVFGRDGFALVTSRSNNSTTTLKEINWATRTSANRSDIPGTGGLLAPDSFLVRASKANASPPTITSEFYENNFDSGMSSLTGYTIGEIGTGEVVVENGKLRLNPGSSFTNRAFVALRTDSAIPDFDPPLSNNTALLTWAFNVSNENGSLNNSFGFAISSVSDPRNGSGFSYRMQGGGYVGSRMIFQQTAFSSSPFGNLSNHLIDETNGLPNNREGAFRITFNPSNGVWNVYYEEGSTAPDPLTITSLLGTTTNTGFTGREMPWIILYSETTGSAYFDNFSFSIGAPSPQDEHEVRGERIDLIEGSSPGTGWFPYTSSDNTFGSGRNHNAKIESAAISPRSGATALSSASDTTVIDESGLQTAVIDKSGTVAFSPTHDHLYLADDSTNEIHVYSTLTWVQLGTITVPGGFIDVPGPFGPGNLAIKPDGREIALVTSQGIRLFDVTPFQSDGLPAITPLEYTFTGGVERGNEGKTHVFTLNNDNGFAVNWTASIDANWLTLSTASGVLTAAESTPISLTTNFAANSLPLGEHTANLSFSNPDTGETASIPVSMVIERSVSLPIYEDFEDALSIAWITSSIVNGRIRRDSGHDSIAGDFHLLMDSSGGNAFNELTLSSNLEGASGVQVRFRARGYGNNRTSSPSSSFTGSRFFDGVAISEDGITWHPVLSFPSEFPSYTEFYIDLDSEIATKGLSYDSSFLIRFSQFGALPIPDGGIALDDIEMTTAADRSQAGQISISAQGSEVVNGGTLDLGNLAKDESVTLTITNSGSGVLRNLNYNTSEFGDFIPNFDSITRLLPGAQMLSEIRPGSLGENAGTVRYTSSDLDNNPFTIDVSAFGAQTLTEWRIEHFGVATSFGIAADTYDQGSNGVTNLEAFAFGLDPNHFNVIPFEITSVTEDHVIAQYQRSPSASVENISFVVEWKDDLKDPTWSSAGVVEEVISNLNGLETIQVTIPRAGVSRKFLRLRINR